MEPSSKTTIYRDRAQISPGLIIAFRSKFLCKNGLNAIISTGLAQMPILFLWSNSCHLPRKFYLGIWALLFIFIPYPLMFRMYKGHFFYLNTDDKLTLYSVVESDFLVRVPWTLAIGNFANSPNMYKGHFFLFETWIQNWLFTVWLTE